MRVKTLSRLSNITTLRVDDALEDTMTRHRVYYGCGQFWMRATITWDDGEEIVESWYYRPHFRIFRPYG